MKYLVLTLMLLSLNVSAQESYAEFLNKIYQCLEEIPVYRIADDEFDYELNEGTCDFTKHMRITRQVLKSGGRGNHCSGIATMLRTEYRRVNRRAVRPPFSPMGTKAATYGKSRAGKRGFEHHPIDENQSRDVIRESLQQVRAGDLLFFRHINCLDQYNFSGHIMTVADVVREGDRITGVKVIEGHQGRSYPTYRTLNIEQIITNAKYNPNDPNSRSGIPDISCCEYRGFTRWNAEK